MEAHFVESAGKAETQHRSLAISVVLYKESTEGGSAVNSPL